MTIDPQRTLVTAFQFGGFDEQGRRLWQALKPLSADWICHTFPDENIHGINHHPYLCARNRAIRDVLLPVIDQFDWILSIDADVTVTSPGVERFLAIDADLVSCECRMANGEAWTSPAAFHTPFWFARTKIFRVVQPPWFAYLYTPDGCELLHCDCSHFAEKCRAAGFSVAHGGHCGHDCARSNQKPIGHQPRLQPEFGQPASS